MAVRRLQHYWIELVLPRCGMRPPWWRRCSGRGGRDKERGREAGEQGSHGRSRHGKPNIRRPWGRYSGVPVIWRQLPRSGCIRTSAVRPAERSTQLEPRGTYHHPLARLRRDESGKVPGGPCSSLLMSPFYTVKMHIPKSRRTTKNYTSDSRSRSPLSIRALRSARNDRIRHITINF